MPRTSVKGQVLTDLVAKFAEPPLVEVTEAQHMDGKSIGMISQQDPLSWKVYVNGAARGVHGSGQVRFTPDPEPTRIFRVGKNRNRNRPILMVGSSGSGPSGFGLCRFGFGFRRQFRYFAAGADISPNRSRSGRYLAGSVESGVDLAGSGGFQVDLRRKIKNIVRSGGFQVALCRKTFQSHWILLILWSGRVARVFGEETRWPTRRDRVLWVATCRRLSDWSVRVVAVRVWASPAGWAG